MRDRQRPRSYRQRKSHFEASDRYRGAAYYDIESSKVLELDAKSDVDMKSSDRISSYLQQIAGGTVATSTAVSPSALVKYSSQSSQTERPIFVSEHSPVGHLGSTDTEYAISPTEYMITPTPKARRATGMEYN